MEQQQGANEGPADGTVRWLDEAEQGSWRCFISGTTVLLNRLERNLLADFDISLDDYAILVLLSESEGRQLRMSRIADQALVPRPQVTYRVTRLEKHGLVERRPAPDDARGKVAHLTEGGLDLLGRAARVHVSNVREHFLDLLAPAEFEAVGDAMAKVHNALVDDDDPRRA